MLGEVSHFVWRRWLTAWLAAVLLGGLEGRAASQARLPLPAPGADHPALFLRAMTRLCAELDRAAAAGGSEPFSLSEELFGKGPLPLVERSEVQVRKTSEGGWMLTGPLAVGARLSVADLQAESPSCAARDNARSGSVRALHEYVRRATCALRASARARCQLQVEEVTRMTRMAEDQPPGAMLPPRRSFVLTLVLPARPPPRPGKKTPVQTRDRS